MKKLVVIACAMLAAGSVSALERFNTYDRAPVGAIVPQGHLREFLVRQREGLTGHREELGYPFNGTMWSEPIKNIHFTEGVYNGADEEVSGRGDWWNSGAWWPYEQSAYQLDGMARLANLIDATDLAREVELNVRNVMKLAAATNGDLFAALLPQSNSQWPLGVFFRAADAWSRKTGNKDFYAALKKHFEVKGEKAVLSWGGRDHVVVIEGGCRAADVLGDEALRQLAVSNYYLHPINGYLGVQRCFNHGVSFCEDLKLPAIVYMATGDAKCRETALAVKRKVFADNEQPCGQISANEFLSGKDPRQGFETCIAADMLWSLGYFLEAFGDTDAADRMERIAYNALPGAITKDFKRHQYLSAVNQVVCSPFANNSHFNYAESAWRQYRPAHFPQCCTGNISRAMPSFVELMWMLTKQGEPVAMLLGPSEFHGEKDGVKYTIVEETDYPFGDEIRFTLKCEQPLSVTLNYRVPGWCGDAAGMARRKLEPGKTFAFTLPFEAKLRRDRSWCWLERGPLTFSFAVPCVTKEDRPGESFSPISFYPNGDWNYAIDFDALKNRQFKVEWTASAYPFETPNLKIRVPVKKIREWQALEQERFMPDPPLFPHLTGESAEIELVPYATTCARVTAFPVAEERELLPVVAAYASGEAYPYNPYKSIAKQIYPPESEKWEPKAYTGRYQVPQRTPEIFFDCTEFFEKKKYEGKLAYLMFRVWSDRNGEATFCLGAANAYQVFWEGKEILREEGMVEGLMMAPVWFNHEVKRGYNYVLVKVGCGTWMGQFRREWGAKLQAFMKK